MNMLTNLREQSLNVFAANKAKGFWPEPALNRSTKQALALIIGEVYEALEADRKGRRADLPAFLQETSGPDMLSSQQWAEIFEKYVKDTVEDEFADVAIRVLDFCGGFDISLLTWQETSSEVRDIPETEFSGFVLYINQELLNLHGSRNTLNWTRVLFLLHKQAASMGFSLQQHITAKLQYNETRAHMHGKKY